MITFKEAVLSLARDERFMAAVSAMNSLLIQKGCYTQEEFEMYFCQWAEMKSKENTAGLNHPGARSTAIR